MVDKRRDPERTRQALLDAALAEFSARGVAGARTSEIAARAGVNKQLISHHFGGKQGLYRALIEDWLAAEEEYGGAEAPLAELLGAYVESAITDRAVHRLLLRVSLEDERTGAGVGPGELEEMRRRQARGELSERLDPAFVLLALEAIASLGLVFPGDARSLTGLDPASAEFGAWHRGQAELLVGMLAPTRTGVRIRAARDGDAKALAALWTEAYAGRGEGEGRVDPYDEAELLAARSHGGSVWVAEDGAGAVAGAVAMRPPGSRGAQVAAEGEAELSRLAVREESRGDGVGRALALHVLELARAAGARGIALWSRPYQRPAHGLYESLGFERVPERDGADPDGRRIAFRRAL